MNRRLRSMIAVTLIFCVAVMLSVCWDQRELDDIFIVTGLALDQNPNPDLIDLTVQVGKPKPKSSGSGGSSDKSDPFIMLKTAEPTVQEGLKMIDQDSSRSLLMQHNQVILFGTAFAQEGVRDKIDQFLRDQESRMEALVLITDGRAEKVLSAKTDQEDITGVYLARLVKDMKGMSPYNAVRMIDLISVLQDPTSSPVVPLVNMFEENGKTIIGLDGMAVFKDDRMIGKLSGQETMGYLLAMGKMKQSTVAAENDMGRAVFDIQKLDTKRTVTLRPDGGVKVILCVNTVLRIGQLVGFYDMNPKELLPHLITMAQSEIQNEIYSTFDLSRSMNADIYGFGGSVYQHYPKMWQDIVKDWNTYYQDIELEVHVKARIPQTGKTVKSLEMDVTSYAN